MNELLRKKLLNTQREIEKERNSLKSIFLAPRSSKEIRSRRADQILREWEEERTTMKKYRMKDSTEMISYIIELDFALRDLLSILRK